jgi:hypothetical protein
LHTGDRSIDGVKARTVEPRPTLRHGTVTLRAIGDTVV